MDRGTPAVVAAIEAATKTVRRRLDVVAKDVGDVIAEQIPELQRSGSIDLLGASTAENLDIAVHLLLGHGDFDNVIAPEAAHEYARRLAQQDVPASALIRAYRIGQLEFLRHLTDELLEHHDGAEDAAGHAVWKMVEAVSSFVDQIVEQVLTTYALARDGWLQSRSAVQAQRVQELLEGSVQDLAATERSLDYRLDATRWHLAAILWVDDDEASEDALEALRDLADRTAATLADDTTRRTDPLFVPESEAAAWMWVPVAVPDPDSPEATVADLLEALEAEVTQYPGVSVALGQPSAGVGGFRRSHEQAQKARAVAVAAGADRRRVTPFGEVAPIAMLCTDLRDARAWVHETLGDLVVDSTRNEGLRETARVFLQAGGSYTATAELLHLHRNTAQYRIRKAEEVRGRPLRDSRLDAEIALLACHWLRGAVLREP